MESSAEYAEKNRMKETEKKTQGKHLECTQISPATKKISIKFKSLSLAVTIFSISELLVWYSISQFFWIHDTFSMPEKHKEKREREKWGLHEWFFGLKKHTISYTSFKIKIFKNISACTQHTERYQRRNSFVCLVVCKRVYIRDLLSFLSALILTKTLAKLFLFWHCFVCGSCLSSHAMPQETNAASFECGACDAYGYIFKYFYFWMNK